MYIYIYIYLTENSKGNPCCAENFINMKKKQHYTLRPKMAKAKEENYKHEKRNGRLAIKLHKALEGQLLTITLSNCLKMGFLDEANFPSLEGGL
jgi:hypothetical protein